MSTVAAAQGAAGREEEKAPEFTVETEVERLDVLSQGRAGTCWSFATTSFLESEVARIHGKAIDLSELFPVYWGYVDKAETFVRLHGKAQFSEGGLSHDVIRMVEKHGIVPAQTYDGLRGDSKVHDHGELAKVLTGMIEALKDSKRPSGQWREAIRSVLDVYLGAAPSSIDVDGKNVTPVEYSKDVLAIPTKSYREVMSFSGQKFWQKAELLVPDNWMRFDDYLNVPLETFMTSFDHALKAGFSVAVDMDVSEPGARGNVWKLSEVLEADGAITDAMRQEMFDSRQTTDDHLMHVVGISRDAEGKKFYLVKNSWGKRGPYEGYLHVSANFMALKLLAFMVHEDGMQKDVLKKFAQ